MSFLLPARPPGLAEAFFLTWLCFSLSAADGYGAEGSCLFRPCLQESSSKAWRALNYYISNRNIGSLLQRWPGHHWRSLASADQKDFFGDYSPRPDVDVVFGPPPPLIGKRRKLLQDYTPEANTSGSPPIGN